MDGYVACLTAAHPSDYPERFATMKRHGQRSWYICATTLTPMPLTPRSTTASSAISTRGQRTRLPSCFSPPKLL